MEKSELILIYLEVVCENIGKIGSWFALREKCSLLEFFWTVFSHNRSAENFSVNAVFSPNAGKCGQENLRMPTFFTQCWILTSLVLVLGTEW